MRDEDYINWKKENDINSLKDLRKWMNDIRVLDDEGRYFIYYYEGNKMAKDFMMRFLDEMPVNRESVEAIWEALRGEDFMCYYYEDELREVLKTKYRSILTVEETEKLFE